MKLSPWWFLGAAIAVGAVATGIAAAIDSGHLDAVAWLGTTAGVAALIVAVGIYRLQERSGNEAHAELMEQIEAQNELLNDFAKRDESSQAAASEGEGAPAQGTRSPAAPADGSRPSTVPAETLTPAQRTQIEAEFGEGSIEAAFDPGRGRGKRGRARLVRLRDGRLVSVYQDPLRERITVREIDPTRRGKGRSAFDRP